MDQHASHKRDPIANSEADVSGIPFTGSFLSPSNTRVVSHILAFTPDGTMTSEVQDQLEDLQPLVEEIIDLLEEASANTGFTFTIPKELYFGDEDVEVSYADLLYYLAAMNGWRAGLSPC